VDERLTELAEIVKRFGEKGEEAGKKKSENE
jgi:hypothetical protein